jgi:hypothetical protein
MHVTKFVMIGGVVLLAALGAVVGLAVTSGSPAPSTVVVSRRVP